MSARFMSCSAVKSLLKGLGFLIVVLLVIATYLLINSEVKTTENSVIGANSFNVAVEYSGVITEQLVEDGDFVQEGQILVQIKSSTLLESINEEKTRRGDLLYTLTDENEIILKAQQAGQIKIVNSAKGSFVAANETIMTIVDTKNPYIESYFELSKEEFNGLNKSSKMRVNLTNNQTVDTPISLIQVDDKNAKELPGIIRVKIKSDIEPDGNLIIGSPVTSKLYLEENTLMQRVSGSLSDIKNRILP